MINFVDIVQGSYKRLDSYLSENISELTRAQIKKHIESGDVTVNDKPAKAGKPLKQGDAIRVEISPDSFPVNAEPENIPLNIVYEDGSFAVINKPQGMVVHPASGVYNGTLVNAILYHFKNVSNVNSTAGVIRPGIVHRIDKDTSGLIVIAKNNAAHLNLAKQIAEKTCRRTYIALVEGIVKADRGIIDKPICRDKKDRKKMAVDDSGKEAVTHYTVLDRFQANTLVQFDLKTGRTHQIRVHSKYIGHPIVGDKTYGFAKQRFNLSGQLLHAARLELRSPETDRIVVFECDLPDYFKKVLGVLKREKK